jgi:hypothetical protein
MGFFSILTFKEVRLGGVGIGGSERVSEKGHVFPINIMTQNAIFYICVVFAQYTTMPAPLVKRLISFDHPGRMASSMVYTRNLRRLHNALHKPI